MKTRSAAVIAHCALGGVLPGYLVLIEYATPLRWSTMGAVQWPSETAPNYTWSAADIEISGVMQDGKGLTNASISVGNADGVMGALVLSEGAQKIAVTIWEVWGGLTALADGLQIFTGVMNGANFDLAGGRIVFPLEALDDSTSQSPRQYIDSISGYGYLKPGGTVIQWGGEAFVLEPVGSPVQVTKP